MIFLSFIAGVILASAVCYIVFSKKNLALKEEIITLSAKSKSTEELQEIIKRDFVQLANETIKNEQEDLRKQNRETLEEKILPLTKELGEFKAKVERFNLAGVENTTKIVEQIGNLEKNNKIKNLSQNAILFTISGFGTRIVSFFFLYIYYFLPIFVFK